MPIRVAIVGVGNCASSFVQGLQFYQNEPGVDLSGLIHHQFGGYHVRDIEVVCAFDINAEKVGKDIAAAIFVQPNNAMRFVDLASTGILVKPGIAADGIADHLAASFQITETSIEQVEDVLRSCKAEICVSYLPVGSRIATENYANACINTGVAFINGMPEQVASNPVWVKRFQDAGLPCAGDDVLSQVGATILHRDVLELIVDRGGKVIDSYQLDIGGNMDFRNMDDEERVRSKRHSKTLHVATSAGTDQIAVAPAALVPHLLDNKVAYINIRGSNFGGAKFDIDLRLSVQDSPNNAAVIFDAVRAMKVSLDRKLIGYQEWSAYYFKRPLEFRSIKDAREIVQRFERGI